VAEKSVAEKSVAEKSVAEKSAAEKSAAGSPDAVTIESLEKRLAEKEEFVKELQHRVKNSIAMISSFVALEEGRAGPGRLHDILESLRFRIDSVSNLYRLAFATGDPDKVDLRTYLERVVFDLSQTVDRPDLSTHQSMEDVVIDPRRAGPIGILCTELVSNALRHGLPATGPCSVAVTLRVAEGRLELVVEDDGDGLPEGFDLETSEGLGLQLARMLALQLKGRLVAEAREGRGTRFAFSMPWPGPA
jgi:two-component sensor histidine kinase